MKIKKKTVDEMLEKFVWEQHYNLYFWMPLDAVKALKEHLHRELSHLLENGTIEGGEIDEKKS